MPDDISSKIEEGDRVDHRLFGLGTATEVDGDKIEIDFDEKPGEIKRVLASFVRKIASGETRPFKFWNRQWLKLYAEWIEARRAFETEATQFRPPPNAQQLAKLRSIEDAAWGRVEAFVEEERCGQHI